MDELLPPPIHAIRSADCIIHVECPNCQSPKGVVAAAHYTEFLCFCPACEHIWDCPGSVLNPPAAGV